MDELQNNYGDGIQDDDLNDGESTNDDESLNSNNDELSSSDSSDNNSSDDELSSSDSSNNNSSDDELQYLYMQELVQECDNYANISLEDLYGSGLSDSLFEDINNENGGKFKYTFII